MGVPDFATINIDYIYCCRKDCDAQIIMPGRVMQQYRDNHDWFYCYRGHRQYFPGKSDEEKLKEQLENKERELASANKRREWTQQELEHEKRSKAAIKGQVTKMKKRAANGVCPCCKRTFANLASHMKTKHPKYGKDKKTK